MQICFKIRKNEHAEFQTPKLIDAIYWHSAADMGLPVPDSAVDGKWYTKTS